MPRSVSCCATAHTAYRIYCVVMKLAAPAQAKQQPALDVGTVEQFCGQWIKVRGPLGHALNMTPQLKAPA